MYQDCMKSRSNRSNPMANIKRGPIPQGSASGYGSLSATKVTQWKPASPKTMSELAVLGKISTADIKDAMSKGHITEQAFKQVFWESVDSFRLSKDQLNMLNDFSSVLI